LGAATPENASEDNLGDYGARGDPRCTIFILASRSQARTGRCTPSSGILPSTPRADEPYVEIHRWRPAENQILVDRAGEFPSAAKAFADAENSGDILRNMSKEGRRCRRGAFRTKTKSTE
jgi:hypothetical protein